MIAAKLIELIELHSTQLSLDVARDLRANARTPGFHQISLDELQRRLFDIIHHLGDWIGDPRSARVQSEFTQWGARRFDQKIPLSEIVYAIIVFKQHLRRYIQDHGLVDASFPRVERDYVLPMHLHSLQELNATVGQFFDEALYYMARAYEAESSRASEIAG
jgi:hypothetical protein